MQLWAKSLKLDSLPECEKIASDCKKNAKNALKYS